ncbi:L,D-transpeptidase [Lutibaculum baratangense]|uniref:L,D-TPase catalytic domain-containing protein n=1 Tax=Lutibaculum baratangense AMV1 TaxID=631454 RepID=V4RPQ1_9HYPH|nr:L,D-transpeptidase [Lutibaculum baratangense]ESR27259.1 hypothetical protein N177_0238 [Lutibaculum baratangense AMV1]
MPTSNNRFPRPRLRGLGIVSCFALALAGCTTTQSTAPVAPVRPAVDPGYVQMYAAIQDGDWHIPAVDVSEIDPRFLRQLVDYDTDEPVGTIVVDPYARFLYLVMENGKAMRYGIGVAKAGLEFQGSATIDRKAQWPGWTPTQNMIAREPERYGPLAGGMEGGIENPLGARALYLYKNGRDTLYRLHGTTEPWSIGKRVSSGCIRLFNQDIIDLHKRVPTGSRVVVLDQSQSGKGEV